MRILVLGASGGCGRWVARLAAADGHAVTAFVRPETAYDPPSGARLERGSVLAAADVARAMAGQDVAISCVGSQRVNPRNPWSPLRPPGRIAEASARVIAAAGAAAGVRRIVAISAAGVADSLPATNAMMRWLLRSSTIGEMYADLEAMEVVYRDSGLDWQAVRPVTLVDAREPSPRAKVVPRFRMVSVIGRVDVAAWLVRTATDPGPIAERTPMIAWR